MGKSKKKAKKLDQLSIYQSIRKGWGEFSPVERVVPNKKSGKYNRAREKRKGFDHE